MFVLDELYVSREVLDFLEESHEPVLDNTASRRLAERRDLSIYPNNERDTQPISILSPYSRIITLSEMHLDDAKHYCTSENVRMIELCKNKAAARRVLAPLYPDYVFDEYSLDDLLGLDPSSISYPVVIKPSTGFFSLGIYPVFNQADWCSAMEDIRANSTSWSGSFNSTVVNDSNFLVESYLEGDEYAIDVYFDNDGEAVVLNILKHEFTGSADVADRLYYTSKHIIETQLEPMTRFLTHVNTLFKAKNFPVHVEVRVAADGSIVPIEFNPLRFAGLSTTDLSYFAYGFKTYEYFLRDQRPDWDVLLTGKDDLVYTMILLGKPGFDAGRSYSFDYDALTAGFCKVCDLRKTDFAEQGAFGFLFTETRSEDWERELDPILNSTLDEFISR